MGRDGRWVALVDARPGADHVTVGTNNIAFRDLVPQSRLSNSETAPNRKMFVSKMVKLKNARVFIAAICTSFPSPVFSYFFRNDRLSFMVPGEKMDSIFSSIICVIRFQAIYAGARIIPPAFFRIVSVLAESFYAAIWMQSAKFFRKSLDPVARALTAHTMPTITDSSNDILIVASWAESIFWTSWFSFHRRRGNYILFCA